MLYFLRLVLVNHQSISLNNELLTWSSNLQYMQCLVGKLSHISFGNLYLHALWLSDFVGLYWLQYQQTLEQKNSFYLLHIHALYAFCILSVYYDLINSSKFWIFDESLSVCFSNLFYLSSRNYSMFNLWQHILLYRLIQTKFAPIDKQISQKEKCKFKGGVCEPSFLKRMKCCNFQTITVMYIKVYIM